MNKGGHVEGVVKGEGEKVREGMWREWVRERERRLGRIYVEGGGK